MQMSVLAVGAMGSLLQAAPTPQEIFTQLSAPSAPPAAPNPAARAERLPSLGLVPLGAEAVVSMVDPGQASLVLMHLLGETPPDDLKQGLASIRDATLMLGQGGGETLRTALPVVSRMSQLAALDRVEKRWSDRARPECAAVIHEAFAKQRRIVKQGMLEAIEALHPAPLYYATTARPGQEAAFEAMHRRLVEGMQAAAQRDPSLSYEEIGDFVGLRCTWLHVYRCLTGSEPADEALSRALQQRELHLLSRNRGGESLQCLCVAPEDVLLPAMPMYSMLYSPTLSHADAHMPHLLAAMWVSSACHQAIRACLQSNRGPVALAAADVMHRLALQEPAHEATYHSAAQDMVWFISQPSLFDESFTPQSMQVWQAGPGAVCVESVAGAQGMEFGQGVLQMVSRANAPGTMFYMESTSFSAPYMPSFAAAWKQTWSAMLGAGKGVLLTLRPELQQEYARRAMWAEQLMPELRSLGNSVSTMGSGLAAPFAVVAAQLPATKGEPATTGVALRTGVSNRGAVAQGWQELLNVLGTTAGKLGLPPMLLSSLPVRRDSLSGGAATYALDIPFYHSEGLPQVAISNTAWVIGNSAALNAQLLAAEGSMPFCGAVNSVHVPLLAKAMEQVQLPESCGYWRMLPRVLNHMAQSVEWVYSVSTINHGVRTARALMLAPATGSHK